jgi:hypothetical protein
MTIEEIVNMWSSDSVIDQTDLINASLSIPRLHSTYFRIFLQEKAILQDYIGAMKLLRLEKYEMYTQGPTADVVVNWKVKVLPDQGLILKSEVQKYIDADLDVLNLERKYTNQLEKVKFVESIISSFRDRGFAIKNAIDMMKFQAGS